MDGEIKEPKEEESAVPYKDVDCQRLEYHIQPSLVPWEPTGDVSLPECLGTSSLSSVVTLPSQLLLQGLQALLSKQPWGCVEGRQLRMVARPLPECSGSYALLSSLVLVHFSFYGSHCPMHLCSRL